MKKETITSLYPRADKLWSDIVKLKSLFNGCEVCGKKENLNAHHLWGRKNISLRWNIENGMCLCPSCHKFSNTFSAHETPLTFGIWIEELKGKDWIKYMILISEVKFKNSIKEMKNIIELLEQYKKELIEQLYDECYDIEDTRILQNFIDKHK